MIHVGSPAEWADLLDSYVPDLLAMVINAWEAMPAPAANAKEDPVSESLCRTLRRLPERCDLPFHIETQRAEIDPTPGEEHGRMDIVFLPFLPDDGIYFCLECKRLNVRGTEGLRPYFNEYVRLGMFRFVRGRYSKAVRCGGMLAFVLDGDVHGAILGVEENIKTHHKELCMAPPGAFEASGVMTSDPRVRETRHHRASSPAPFLIHHLFMKGDPAAPMIPEPPPSVPAAQPLKKPRNSRRKSRK